ncbi:TIGR03808 family TAT-translocated repetitive protein [Roseibium denhamense]|uniref:TIGR03808 family TAT-translocated repetitive protein n=1 Tax=Roseibium denhamense TaxID=76305 RepID=UPI0012BCB2ED|nr:TIGR03808 family TAT-translocated repetitive protein [Roseibium denhamense]MTI06073.1 TIGR03808 family TAT-translocated repetitive protein [Roseibium denhamense]
MTSRRAFLAGTALCLSGTAAMAQMKIADLRGSIDSAELGLLPNAGSDQTAQFQNAVNRAVERGRALFLPAGTYPVANLRLPSGTLIVGVPGRTRLVYEGGGGQLIRAEGVNNIGLNGVTFDGANRSIGDFTEGLLHFIGVRDLVLENCEIAGSAKSGLVLDRCSGRVTECRISGAAETALWSNEATGLSITGNTVTDCANGGIWIYRWREGEDGTIVSGNRIERIGARFGGTGQYGNGINVFRADGVIVSNNRVADCAFSAIRSNAGSNVQIIGNSCLRSGETAIYSEFGFQGAVISNNLVDGGTIGISIANFVDDGRLAVCNGNLIRNIKDEGPYPPEVAGFGIGIAAEADTSLTGNVIEGAPKFGLMLGWGPYMRNIVASQNVVRDCGNGIAVSVVDGTGSAVISNNVVQGSKRGAINGFRWLEKATDELNGQSGYPNLTVTGNQVSA